MCLPYTPWTFLGVTYHQGVIDVSKVSVDKLKAKMKRKARALLRWKKRKCVSNVKAAKAFIRVFNEKLYENPSQHELTWVNWYFPMINTDASLKVMDHYMQDLIRYIVSEKVQKSKYNFTYEEMKKLGYRSLVNVYYKHRENNDII